jgi:hypothetical protein
MGDVLHGHFINGVVAVFLRRLEWFTGILFLSERRTMSLRFSADFHIVVEYRELNQAQRMQIWRQPCPTLIRVYTPGVHHTEKVLSWAHKHLPGESFCRRANIGFSIDIYPMQNFHHLDMQGSKVGQHKNVYKCMKNNSHPHGPKTK